jgi:hypothetical protein
VTRRGADAFAYLELDPWFVVGASVGVGVGTESGWRPIIGVWEGIPLNELCPGATSSGGTTLITISVGVRWAGATELFVGPKIGWMRRKVC